MPIRLLGQALYQHLVKVHMMEANYLIHSSVPLICSGHSRPVPDLSYSQITADGFFLVSACLGTVNMQPTFQDGKPMLRNGETGDWVGTFIGHKGAVWSAHLNSDISKAITGSADYTA